MNPNRKNRDPEWNWFEEKSFWATFTLEDGVLFVLALCGVGLLVYALVTS